MRRFALAAALVVIGIPLYAMTAGEFLSKMGKPEQAGYIAGAVDMAIASEPARAACIRAWYYHSGGEAQKLMAQALGEYRDKEVIAVLRAVIDRQCPK
jgi:hypothetical protein